MKNIFADIMHFLTKGKAYVRIPVYFNQPPDDKELEMQCVDCKFKRKVVKIMKFKLGPMKFKNYLCKFCWDETFENIHKPNKADYINKKIKKIYMKFLKNELGLKE